jgi:ethanolamine utilization protein EutJ
VEEIDLDREVIERIEKTRGLMDEGHRADSIKPPLVAGVDLGTSNIQVIVVDSEEKPVAAFFEWDSAVRDGIVVDYTGACSQLRGIKKQINSVLGEEYELTKAAVGYPPGTEAWVETNVVKECGFEIVAEVDEPTAAAEALGLSEGALVDIGGGTTGITVLKEGEVVYTADEATGGHHLSLVIAGREKISFEEAEEKKISSSFAAYTDIVRPVIQKMASIVKEELEAFPEIETVYLVGGTSIPEGFEDIFAEELKRDVYKPPDPILITPLGIALRGLKVDSQKK